MFKNNRKKPDLVLWVFGLIAFGIIMSLAVLMFMLFSSPKEDIDIEMNVDKIEDTAVPSFTTEELKEEYNYAIQDLALDISNEAEGNLDDVLSNVENKLLSIRVPKEMRDSHLNVVLSIVKLRAKALQSPDEVQSELLDLLQHLSTRAL